MRVQKGSMMISPKDIADIRNALTPLGTLLQLMTADGSASQEAVGDATASLQRALVILKKGEPPTTGLPAIRASAIESLVTQVVDEGMIHRLDVAGEAVNAAVSDLPPLFGTFVLRERLDTFARLCGLDPSEIPNYRTHGEQP